MKYNLYERMNNESYNMNGKRYNNKEKRGDSLICINSDGQVKIQKGEIYIIQKIDKDWVQIEGNSTMYMWNRFMLVDKHREILIKELLYNL